MPFDVADFGKFPILEVVGSTVREDRDVMGVAYRIEKAQPDGKHHTR